MEWNHGLGEIIQALLSAGIEITAMAEHTSVPWEARPGEMTLGDDDEWRMTEHPERLPLTYTLQGVRIADGVRAGQSGPVGGSAGRLDRRTRTRGPGADRV